VNRSRIGWWASCGQHRPLTAVEDVGKTGEPQCAQRRAVTHAASPSATPLACVAAFFTVVVALAGCTGTVPARLPSLASPIYRPPTVAGSPAVRGPLSSAGGPFLHDAQGRVVLLHGVNAVYKLPPFELFPAAGKPWDFTAADASLMARLGFNVVRLGMTWKGLEPGTAPSNDPAICTPGTPHDPGQFNQEALDGYLGKLAQTVALLGRFHIYTLLDMHQDVYNERFDGEGAPNWAVCTDGLLNTEAPGRWSQNYGTAAAGAAYRHFWTNDVVGDLQGEYDRVWAAVAGYFRGNPWVVGYDPFNEPFSTSLVSSGDEQFDGQLECFYTGTAHLGVPGHGAPAITCPRDDPSHGVIPQILSADPLHLIFYEPDIFSRRGSTNFVGAMNLPDLVFNVHVYCTQRSGKTGNPTNVKACAAQEGHSLNTRSEDRTDLLSPAQPRGPAWFVSEFGATSSPALLDQLTAEADRALVGWTYWSWKYYGDPTGSAAEGLVTSEGQLRQTADVLARTYPEAIAGRPVSISFDPTSGTFRLVYVPDHVVRAPTVIFVPTQVHYLDGYCARVAGGSVISRPGSALLEVANAATKSSVTVRVTSGSCTHR